MTRAFYYAQIQFSLSGGIWWVMWCNVLIYKDLYKQNVYFYFPLTVLHRGFGFEIHIYFKMLI